MDVITGLAIIAGVVAFAVVIGEVYKWLYELGEWGL